MPIVKRARQSETASRFKVGLRDVTNDAELESFLRQDLEAMVDDVINDLQATLMEYIDEYVYSSSNTWYVSTGQFPLSWTVQKIKSNLQASLVFDPTGVMRWDRGWEHGSKMGNWNSAVPYMADLLNKTGGTSSLGWNDRKVGYWDKFVADMFDGGEVDRMFAMKFQGF